VIHHSAMGRSAFCSQRQLPWSFSRSQSSPVQVLIWFIKYPARRLLLPVLGKYRNFIQNQDGYFPGSIPKPQEQMSATKTNLQLKGPMTRKNRPIWELVDQISTEAWISIKIF
jgi:hypothetical protein